MECTLDKAVYTPGDSVTCTVSGLPADSAALRVSLVHLTDTISVQITENESVSLALPMDDYTGYLLRAEAMDSAGSVLTTAYNAVDCSSDWTRFPRYGYVWDFTENADAEAKIALLSRYHLNGLQFYDWQYRHHLPVAPDTDA